MKKGQKATKTALLQAAAELFADFGFDGASTREITQKANANTASIRYHFHDKENLYIEAIRYALAQKGTWAESTARALELTKNGASVYEALRAAFRHRLDEHFGGGWPAWRLKLILHMFLGPSPAMKS
jgi:AcrR family transcriptional regulator